MWWNPQSFTIQLLFSLNSAKLIEWKPYCVRRCGQDNHFPECRMWWRLYLSHEQKTGFSFNKELTVENQKKRSLMAQMLTADRVRSVWGITKVKITEELLPSVAEARLPGWREKKEQQAVDLQRQALWDEQHDWRLIFIRRNKQTNLHHQIQQLLSNYKRQKNRFSAADWKAYWWDPCRNEKKNQ